MARLAYLPVYLLLRKDDYPQLQIICTTIVLKVQREAEINTTFDKDALENCSCLPSF